MTILFCFSGKISRQYIFSFCNRNMSYVFSFLLRFYLRVSLFAKYKSGQFQSIFPRFCSSMALSYCRCTGTLQPMHTRMCVHSLSSLSPPTPPSLHSLTSHPFCCLPLLCTLQPLELTSVSFYHGECHLF